jgi:hemerythrin-like domain-containing protein
MTCIEEHALIRRMISVLEVLGSDLKEGRPRAVASLREAITFVRGFSDKCHHGKEERILFPLLAAKNQTMARMPVRILTSEHDAGRTLIAKLEAALDRLEAGDADDFAEPAEALTLYTTMLRKHIDKEEDIVFPLAKTMISDEEASALVEQFEAVEEELGRGAHEFYSSLLESLEHHTDTRVTTEA